MPWPAMSDLARTPMHSAAEKTGRDTRAPVSASAIRTFVGWDRLPIDAVLEPLVERCGPGNAACVLAFPGSRSGRLMRARLARRIGPRFVPPRIVTLGTLVDELVNLDRPVATRRVRTLAWQQALSLLGSELAAITEPIPGVDDHRAWAGLAATVRALHGELGAEGRDFASVLADPEVAARSWERERWQALEHAHVHFRRLLASEGLLDPHDARRAAIEAGRIDTSRDVMLVGCLELTGLQRSLLRRLGERVRALVPAPPEAALAFDAFGAADVDHWCARPMPVDLARWRVVADPAGQAQAVIDWLASLAARRSPAEITVGLLDDEVRPLLARRLAGFGLKARSAAGTPLAHTAPARLMAAVGTFLVRRRFTDFAALVRFPEIEALLRLEPALRGQPPADWLDRYHAEHLPARVSGHWCSEPPRNEGLQVAVCAVYTGLESLLGDLWTAKRRLLPAWIGSVRALLERVYAGADLLAAGRSGRPLADEIAALAPALADLESVPAALAPEVLSGTALVMLGEEIAGVAVAPSGGDSETLELLGWLELAMDDAPSLALTGLAEGRVPASPDGDAFLPDRLRRRLGLVDDRRRLARDACIFHLLLRSRPELLLVSARRDAARNPLMPSRLLLRAASEKVVARVEHAFAAVPSQRPGGRGTSKPHALARLAPRALEHMPVTAFATFIASPYRYYLERHLGVRDRDDAAREMDGRLFGSLLHEVLAMLGAPPWSGSSDPAAIARFLKQCLQHAVRRRFGEDLLPAVRFQILQAQWRLERFAAEQAAHAAEGWRIVETEWRPRGGGVRFDVDGDPIRITGQIDRIDRHADGRFAILDYKTGNQMPSASRVRKRDGRWLDLQLPLYRLLAAELDPQIAAGERVVFGYACLGPDEASTDIRLAPWGGPVWDGEALAAADETAREVVRAIRQQRCFDVGTWKPTDPVSAALAGLGLIGAQDDGEAEEMP